MASLIYSQPAAPHSAPHIPHEYVTIDPGPETIPIMQKVFQVLRHDWIRNFLFTTDPIEVTVLTSLAAAHAATVTFQESSIGRSHSSTEAFPVTVEGETVLIPAFTSDQFSVGVGIKKRTSDIPKDVQLMPWTGQLTSEHLRFVSDTGTGSYFVVRQSRFLPYIFIEVFTLISPVLRQRTVLTFHVSKLNHLVQRYNFTSFPYIAHTALAMVQVISESRECNTCGSALDPRCRCPLAVQKPQHPVDFEAMKSNLASHFGAFQGAETLYRYTAGAQIASAELGARFSVAIGTDPRRTRDLIYWAINDRIVSGSPGLMRQLHPVCNDEASLIGYFGDLDNLEEEGHDILANNLDMFESNFRRSSEPSDVVGRVRKSSSPSEAGLDQGRDSTPSSNDQGGLDNSSTPSLADDTKDVLIIPRDPEKLAKTRMRREKNREAARRSNLSKKLKTEELRKEVAVTTERMKELQAKEAELRLENSRLRKLASDVRI